MIFNNNKRSIQGVVSQPDYDTCDYIGKDTNTAIVTVDNKTREISVEVLLDDLLGFTSNKAFPGHLGKGIADLANATSAKTQEEIARAKEAEDKLNYKIISNTKLIQSVQELLQEELNQIKSNQTALSEELTKVNTSLEVTKQEMLDAINELIKSMNQHDAELRANIEDVQNTVDDQLTHIQESINNTEQQLNDQIASVQTNLNAVSSEMTTEVRQVRSELASSVQTIEQQITDVESSLEETLASNRAQIENNINTQIANLQKTITTTEAELSSKIIKGDSELQEQINKIHTDYADKTYVYEQFVEFTKLSKQLADSVNLELGVVIINNEQITPIDGVIYLVKDNSATGADVYKEYTTIDNKLTLIGDTSVDFTGYATEEFVLKAVDAATGVDLSEYAKKSEIPDVSDFITNIPDEYVTESELGTYDYLDTTEVQEILNTIEFIDGGSAPL